MKLFMLEYKKIIISEAQRGLLFKDKQFVKVLAPGVHFVWDWQSRYQVQITDILRTLVDGVAKEVIYLSELHAEAFATHLQAWETAEHEVGLVYQNNVLKDIKAPAQRGAFWKTQHDIRVEKIDISEDFVVSKKLAALLSNAKDDLLKQAATTAIVSASVPERHVGFLELDGENVATLAAGTYIWWKFNRNIKVTMLDGRLQNMEVNGQEILTKDRVSLRVNLSATWQIKDASVVKAELEIGRAHV